MFTFLKNMLCRDFDLSVLQKRRKDSLEELKKLTEELNSRSEVLKEEQKRMSLDFLLNQFSLELSDVSVFSSAKEIAELVLESAKKLTKSNSGFVFLLTNGQGLNGDRKEIVTTESRLHNCTLKKLLDCPYELFESNRKDILVSNDMTEKKCTLDCGFTNFLSVPVLVDNELVSRVIVSNKDGEYTESDIEVMKKIAELFSCTLVKLKCLQKSSLQKNIVSLVRYFVDNFEFPVFWAEQSGKIVYMNKALSEKFHFTTPKEEKITVFDLFTRISPKKWTSFLEKIDSSKSSSINTTLLNKRPVKISSFLSEEEGKKIIMSVLLPRKFSVKRS